MDPELMDHFNTLEKMDDRKRVVQGITGIANVKPVPTLATQIGGNHYKQLPIEPLVYIMANKLGFVEGSVVKYVSRWKFKGGIQDLEKAAHLLLAYVEDLKAKNPEGLVVNRG